MLKALGHSAALPARLVSGKACLTELAELEGEKLIIVLARFVSTGHTSCVWWTSTIEHAAETPNRLQPARKKGKSR
jgi:hypothetical protein